MEWFGISTYGPPNPIKETMRPDYHEPTKPENLLEVYEKSDKKNPFSSYIREIDIYITQADGYAYNSYDRLIKMRKKASFKPVGPLDMFRKPVCTSMDYGWNLKDPALEGETWYKTFNKYL